MLKEIREVRKLEKQNRYYDICENYPDLMNYNKAMDFESMRETGKKYKYRLCKKAMYGAVGIFAVASTITILFDTLKLNIYEANEEAIVSYDNSLEEYASQFDTDTMSSMDIIMTVMNDIRSNTRYGINPDVEEVNCYSRLVLDENNDIGVCRNMADKFTTIMNMIDPRFEASNLSVYLDTNCKTYTPCDIDRPIYETVSSEENDSTEENSRSANHMVSILKPIDKDYYLVVDVTNPSIGILNNGKIYMFNTGDYSFIEYRPFEQFILGVNNSFSDVNKKMLFSYFQDIDLNELDSEYGLDKQNKTLEKIKKS